MILELNEGELPINTEKASTKYTPIKAFPKFNKNLLFSISLIFVGLFIIICSSKFWKNNNIICNPLSTSITSNVTKVSSFHLNQTISLLSVYGLSETQINNAKAIFSFFINKGWTAQSICGMLGNIQVESGFRPDLHEYGGGPGYGLVQWTPKSKLVDWANSRNLNYKTLETQCQRIQWELENKQQWISTKAYSMTFKQFSQSRQTPTYLANAFIRNYERPKVQNQPKRGQYAEYWYKTLSGGSNSIKVDDDNGASGRWLGTVSGANTKDSNNGYAGIIGRSIDSVAVSGRYRYRVHILNGGWLDEVSGFDTTNSNTGYAGIIGKKIDGFMIKGLKYRCHTDEGWYPSVTGYNTKDSNNGYAGKFGHAIDAIIIYGTTYQVHII